MTTFQFLYGAIGRDFIESPDYEAAEFQFLYGAIGSLVWLLQVWPL